jgi:hypothetical protein
MMPVKRSGSAPPREAIDFRAIRKSWERCKTDDVGRIGILAHRLKPGEEFG